MSTSETVRSVNPSALSGVRFLITKRIEDLDAASARLQARQGHAAERRDQLRDRLEEAEISWGHLLKGLDRFAAEDIDMQFRLVSSTRADLAALQERVRDIGTRLNDIRHEQEVLRSVSCGLDDLAASTGTPTALGTVRLRNTSRQVFQILEEERTRIARNMQDGPAQSMADLVLQAEILERLISRDPHRVVSELADFKHDVRSVLDETRRLIFDLRPMTLDELGLVPTLRKFIKDFGDKFAVTTHLGIRGEEARLPGALEPTLFRIIQEAMANAGRHGQPTNVEVAITFAGSGVNVVVRDDGCGFDVATTEAGLDDGRHPGMVAMRERVALEKGRLEIVSEIGQGTEVRAIFEY
ncbi:MAG: histidine kinase [Candidatus Dormibacteria bacterium]